MDGGPDADEPAGDSFRAGTVEVFFFVFLDPVGFFVAFAFVVPFFVPPTCCPLPERSMSPQSISVPSSAVSRFPARAVEPPFAVFAFLLFVAVVVLLLPLLILDGRFVRDLRGVLDAVRLSGTVDSSSNASNVSSSSSPGRLDARPLERRGVFDIFCVSFRAML